MASSELVEWCNISINEVGFIDFPESIFNKIDESNVVELVTNFSQKNLMKLPPSEVKFFEWLKQEDPDVWQDLWGEDENEPYLVGVGFLPLLIDRDRGYPICDLIKADNYFFTKQHLPDKVSDLFLDAVKDRFHSQEKLSPAQLLALEISVAPIDIWHFAYKFKLPLDRAKQAVDELVEDGVLVHLKKVEHVTSFIDF